MMALPVNPCVEDASRGLARSIVKLHRNRLRQTCPKTEGHPLGLPACEPYGILFLSLVSSGAKEYDAPRLEAM